MGTVQEALSAVMGDVQAVGKDGLNKAQNYSFRGVDAVVNAVGPALREHKVIVLPRVLSSSYDTFSTSKGALMHQCILEVEFTFVGPEGDTLVCSAMGESADSGDKATPKAHSVAYRTALLQALCIPTDEPDPDSQSYERVQPVTVTYVSAEQTDELKARLRKLPDYMQEAAAPLIVQAGYRWEQLTPELFVEATRFVEACEAEVSA